MISPIFVSLRPKLWNKNLLVFIGILFTKNTLIFEWKPWLYCFIAFAIFCGLSGCVYILNDIIDIAKDRNHPIKSRKPITSGLVSLKEAKSTLLIILFICLFASWKISESFFAISLSFFMLNMAYYFKFKRVMIIESICVATSYVLKTLAGIEILRIFNNSIGFSIWLIICIFCIGMLSDFAKRKWKLINFESSTSISDNSKTLNSIEYLNQILSILSTLSIITYILFTMNTNLNSNSVFYLYFTNLLMIYCIFRYLFLIQCYDEKNLITSDKPLIIGKIFLIISVVIIIHFL